VGDLARGPPTCLCYSLGSNGWEQRCDSNRFGVWTLSQSKRLQALRDLQLISGERVDVFCWCSLCSQRCSTESFNTVFLAPSLHDPPARDPFFWWRQLAEIDAIFGSPPG
jgi:hypothetical protein